MAKEEKKKIVMEKTSISTPCTVVRLKRSGGRIVQGCDVYIGRQWTMGGWNLPQSKWHNPFSVKSCGGSVTEAVRQFEAYLFAPAQASLLALVRSELRGKVLGCWCKHKPSDPCHGDVLARIANQ